MAETNADPRNVVTVLRADGSADPSRDPGLPVDTLVRAYATMLTARGLAARLSASPRVGFFAAHVGDEGAEVGAALALRDGDWLFPSQRDVAATLARGVPATRIAHQAQGTALDPGRARLAPGAAGGRAARVVPPSAPTGGHLTHATGLAWAARTRGESLVAMALFGEGLLDAAEIHNALNFAGVFKVPFVAVCKNAAHGRGVDAEGHAIAYGITGIRCDGTDVLAVMAAARRAVAHAAEGHGPVLLECLVERAATAADLVPAADPIARLRAHLVTLGADVEKAARDAEAEVGAAIAQADAAPMPDPSSLFEDVYAQLPAHLGEQRAALLGR
jgi:TPP-dependent pyruvate/acetoin dehydrogenase alpha subunit